MTNRTSVILSEVSNSNEVDRISDSFAQRSRYWTLTSVPVCEIICGRRIRAESDNQRPSRRRLLWLMRDNSSISVPSSSGIALEHFDQFQIPPGSNPET